MPGNLKLFLVTIRQDTEIVERRYVRVDMTYIAEDDVIDMMEHELRSNIETLCGKATFDILPVTYLVLEEIKES